MVRAIIAMNLDPGAAGAGNRAKRRAGIPVVDSTKTGPFGCIAMGAGEIAAMMRRSPD